MNIYPRAFNSELFEVEFLKLMKWEELQMNKQPEI